MRFGVFIAFGTLLAPAQVEARTPEIERAKVLIAAASYDEAEQVLLSVRNRSELKVEIPFLLGMIALARNAPRSAIGSFRQALVHEPNSIRLRLELARAFYLDGDYENAFRQFQRARAGNPPKPVVAAIDSYLASIRMDKSWSYSVRLSLAPDSNLNSATSATSTEILGLPFELDPSARRRSGVGAAVEAGTEFSPHIGPSARLRFGTQVQRREYRGGRFDDTIVAFHAGPRLVRGRWDLSLLGTAFRRWYGGERYVDGYGARAEVTFYPSSATQIAAIVSAQKLEYARRPQEDGRLLSANFSAVRVLTPASGVVGRIGIARTTARDPQFSNWSTNLGVGYFRDFGGGFSAFVEPSIGSVRYDAPDALIGERRSDRIGQLTLSILNRRIVASRFTPRISFTHTRRFSNGDLYRFKKNRLEVGLTSEF